MLKKKKREKEQSNPPPIHDPSFEMTPSKTVPRKPSLLPQAPPTEGNPLNGDAHGSRRSNGTFHQNSDDFKSTHARFKMDRCSTIQFYLHFNTFLSGTKESAAIDRIKDQAKPAATQLDPL